MDKKSLIIIALLLMVSLIGVVSSEELMGSEITPIRLIGKPEYRNLTESFGSVVGVDIDENFGGFNTHGPGDVNGDGFDDLLITANNGKLNGVPSGTIYILFGRGAGFPIDDPIGNADVKFNAEPGEYVTRSSGAGDVNGDGFDDILFASISHPNETYRGKTYLFFGRRTEDWKYNYLSNESDASFIGETESISSGYVSGGAGDLNGDDIDDFFITAPGFDHGNITRCGLVYLLFGKSEGWTNNVILGNSTVNASYYGEGPVDLIGYMNSVSKVGDVNNDGYDDFMIATQRHNNSQYRGESYLILGKETGWQFVADIGEACDVRFQGSIHREFSRFLGGWGDVNNDGFDDILIGSPYVDEGYVYLFFGNEKGWNKTTFTNESDVVFSGGMGGSSRTGFSVAILGDVNLDGYDDIAIGSPYYHNISLGRTGSVFVYLGREKEEMNRTVDLMSFSDFIYLGERPGGVGGYNHLCRVGDINDDGYSDMLVGMRTYNLNRGKAYFVLIDRAREQESTYSVELFSDEECTNRITNAMVGDRVYVKLIGTDGNISHQDQAFVNITMPSGSTMSIMLRETELNTGEYVGDFVLGGVYNTFKRTYPCKTWNTLDIYATKDPTKNASLLIDTWIDLYPDNSITPVFEGEEVNIQYSTRGRNEATSWEVCLDCEADWLTWDPETKTISGTPDNTDIRSFHIWINVSDDHGHTDSNYLYFNVINRAPAILTENFLDAYEDVEYLVDYDTDQDGQGEITWSMDTDAPFLMLDPDTGILNGKPVNYEDGEYYVNITVHDGNWGWTHTQFNLTVHDVNKIPLIGNEDVVEVYEDEFYLVDYSATDRDWDDVLNWSLETNCDWLELDPYTNSLRGIPRNADVGPHFVNISVSDGRGGIDFHKFTLNIFNTNDPPVWSSHIEDLDLIEGEDLSIFFSAWDEDVGDILEYSVSSFPRISLYVDPINGSFHWKGTREGLFQVSDGIFSLEVTVGASDGEETIYQSFLVNVISNESPTTQLIVGGSSYAMSIDGIHLGWIGMDPDSDWIEYTVTIDEDPFKVLNRAFDCLITAETTDQIYLPEGLEQGKTYFWTVIPNDGISDGICLSGVEEFHVNAPPIFYDPGTKEITFGGLLLMSIQAFDPDPIESYQLTYSIKDSPEGLTISQTDGTIRWWTTQDHIGNHSVTVICSDGLDNKEVTFTITVLDVEDEYDVSSTSDEGTNGIMIFLVVLIVVSVLMFLVVILFAYMGKTEENEYIMESEEELTPLVEEEYEEEFQDDT